mgnify:FL=1
MGDERQDTGESMKEIIGAVKKYFPGALSAVQGQLLPSATAQMKADLAVSKPYAQEGYDIFAELAPKYAQTASDIDDLTQKAASQRELDIAQTTGRGLVTEADLAQKQLDPEFYAQREALSAGLSKYIQAADPTLTENEREEIRRGIGRTPFNPESGIDTAVNAMQFGEKGREKTALFGEALSRVASALPAMQSGLVGTDIASKRGVANTASGRVGGVMTGSGSLAPNLYSAMLGNAGGIQQQAMTQQLSTWDQVGKGFELGGSVLGGVLGALKV